MTINTKPVIHINVILSNVFIRKDGKYIVLKRSKLKVHAPNVVQPVGGKLEKDEDPFTAAIREVKEEIGIEINNVRLEAVVLEVFNRLISPTNWLIFYFSADYKSGEVKETEEGKVLLLSESEIKKSNLLPSVRNIINTIFNPQDGVVFTTNYHEDFSNSLKEKSRNVCVVN